MRSNFNEAKISLYIVAIILSISILFYFVASMFISMGYEGYRNSKNTISNAMNKSTVIIIDAGHGGEDPGAIANDLIEKNLNLELAVSLQELLTSSGYKVVLTRKDDRLLYKNGQEHKKKFYDLRNRAEIAAEINDAVFVSIHMNKFPDESCKGLQTFYSENNQNGKILAEYIQQSAGLLQTNNNRKIKSGNETIFLLEKLEIPAILIECGFISNKEEASMLSTDSYKDALVLSIYCGISEFLENNL